MQEQQFNWITGDFIEGNSPIKTEQTFHKDQKVLAKDSNGVYVVAKILKVVDFYYYVLPENGKPFETAFVKECISNG